MKFYLKILFILSICLIIIESLWSAGKSEEISNLVPVGKGWAGNSINAVIFRRNSIVSHQNVQYAAFYDDHANVVLAKRKLGTEKWQVRQTKYKGNIRDAHNSISMMVDGEGILHLAWGYKRRWCATNNAHKIIIVCLCCLLDAIHKFSTPNSINVSVENANCFSLSVRSFCHYHCFEITSLISRGSMQI